jgi:hypothetical protein
VQCGHRSRQQRRQIQNLDAGKRFRAHYRYSSAVMTLVSRQVVRK